MLATRGLSSRPARRFAARNAERLRSAVLGVPARPVRGSPRCSAAQMVRDGWPEVGVQQQHPMAQQVLPLYLVCMRWRRGKRWGLS
jgi:hypothetical protein